MQRQRTQKEILLFTLFFLIKMTIGCTASFSKKAVEEKEAAIDSTPNKPPAQKADAVAESVESKNREGKQIPPHDQGDVPGQNPHSNKPRSTDPVSAKQPKKVVLVLIDTLRPDYLGFYGFQYETAPFLARLAERSTVFHNALSSSSWTAPATASLFTSLYPPQHGVTVGYRIQLGAKASQKGVADSKIVLKGIPGKITTLPQKMSELGYETFGISANINIGKELGFARGFDNYEKKVKATADYFLAKVEDWKSKLDSAERYFLYLHFIDVHHPYHKREKYYRRSKKGRDRNHPADRYRSEIGYWDHYLEKIYNLLELERESVIILLSDHGEEFWDHGSQGHGPTLYRELNRILLMTFGPDLGIRSGRIEQNVSINDVYPTVLELVGRRAPTLFEGVSLVPLLRGGKGEKELSSRLNNRLIFAHRMYSGRANLAIWSVAQKEWHLIDYWGERRELFNTKEDPRERFDVKLKRTEHAEKLMERMRQFKSRMKKVDLPSSLKKEIELDNALLSQLTNLGYVE